MPCSAAVFLARCVALLRPPRNCFCRAILLAAAHAICLSHDHDPCACRSTRRRPATWKPVCPCRPPCCRQFCTLLLRGNTDCRKAVRLHPLWAGGAPCPTALTLRVGRRDRSSARSISCNKKLTGSSECECSLSLLHGDLLLSAPVQHVTPPPLDLQTAGPL